MRLALLKSFRLNWLTSCDLCVCVLWTPGIRQRRLSSRWCYRTALYSELKIPCYTSCTWHMIHPNWSSVLIIGASLSEPHTSVTSLHTCVCMLACLLACLLAWTDHLPKILNERVFLILRRSSSWLLPECSVGYLELRRLSWSTHGILLLVCYRSSTAGCPQAVQISITKVWAVASGR